MGKMLFRKVLGHLEPADDAAREFVAKTKPGRDVLMEGRRARNPRHHRLLFCLLQIVVDNSERYQTVDHLLDALKIATGHYREYPSIDGKTRYIVPKSIAFESLDQTEFSAWFERALDIIVGKILIGTEKEALRAEVERIAYGQYAA